jgi:transcriptional regulator with XRE-family HTH domain
MVETGAVTNRSSPSFKRKILARTLRQLRTRVGLSMEAAAEPLFSSHTTLSRIELGHQKVGPHLLKSMLDLYGVPVNEWEPLLELCLESRKRGWWHEFGVNAADGAYVGLETEAQEVWEFALTMVPGLLQCPDYVRAILLMNGTSSEALARQVDFRLARQERLTDDSPLRVHAIIDQVALLRPVGGERVRRAQCDYLAGMCELPNVTIQILPIEAGGYVGMHAAYTVLNFATETGFPDMLYHQYTGGEMFVDDHERTGKCKRLFAETAKIALGAPESVALLERMAAQS